MSLFNHILSGSSKNIKEPEKWLQFSDTEGRNICLAYEPQNEHIITPENRGLWRTRWMADYHRFVAYIYEYVNGKKMQNTGFAKIELRNAICRIQIHIQNIRMLDGKTEVFGIVRQPKESRKNNPIILLIGEGQTQGSGFDRRFTVPEEPFVEESCRFEQVCGIYIRSQSGRNWMTVFDDEPIAIENLGKPEEIKAETDEENVKKSETDKEAVEENETDKENVGIKENEKSEKSTESEADQELQEENINLDITEHAKAEPEITAEEMQEEIFSKEAVIVGIKGVRTITCAFLLL